MATCSSCSAELTPGCRWCGICRTNIVTPSVGRLASPSKRLAAHFLDGIIPVLGLVVILVLTVASHSSGAGAGVGVLMGVGMILTYIVWALMLFGRGRTPGKHMMGLRVVRESGQPAGFATMFFREWLGKMLSSLILSLGFLWILFDRDKQGWHDTLMSTYVVE